MTENNKKPKDVTVAKAKGRPMLTWVGKRPLARVKVYPAQAIERVDATGSQPTPLQEADWSDWPKDLPQGGLLYHGDNKDVLAHLLGNGFRGKINLVYIDPPFDSGADYVRKVQLRGAKGMVKIDGEDYTLGEQVQYSDIWANDNYLQFMYERLLMLRELLSESGSIFLHCDSSKGHLLRLLLDEVFGQDKYFRNEIVWSYRRWPSASPNFQQMHDSIFWYSKSNDNSHTFHKSYEAASESYMKRFGGKTQILDEETGTRKITSEEETKGMPTRDVWDISIIAGFKGERTGYPTQKPIELLERIISSCSNPGDIILDCFVGSGTTAEAAQRLGRRWVGCDINKGAIQTTAKRLQELMRAQASAVSTPQQGDLVGTTDTTQKPSQLSFATYRVNDYDLQIQHNEAVELACMYLGVTRTRTDSFFDGTQGGRLVKIVPFNHPLTPLDLEDVRNELRSRPTEERDVTVVCLGWQHDARAWVETYNRNHPVNKLHVVELRTDRKLGGFIKHEPLSAQVSVGRVESGNNFKLVVEVHDVVSPTIVQRLNLEQGVFRAQITDWRAMVDYILIDTRYDGQIFNVELADVPEGKQGLVVGRYELPAPPAGSVVAIKIVDMLGEELVITFDL